MAKGRRILVLAAAAGLVLWAGPAGWAGPEDPVPGLAVPLENRERVRQIDAANAARHKGDAEVLVLPGLVADRKRQRVEVLAESTGLSSKSIVEFLVISETSQHGYEALSVSFAKPSDIHRALEFIGMKAGAPYNPQELRMWPKGERVLVSLAPQGSTSTPARIERLVMDTTTGAALPEAGFVFTGSVRVPFEKGKGSEYGADAWEPKAVVSIYNEPYSVLDIPRLTRKSEVYGEQVVHPQHVMSNGVLLSLFLEPEYKDGRRRVRDLALEVAPGAAAAEGEPQFSLAGADGQALSGGQGPDGVRRELETLAAQGCDPFVSVRFHRALRLDAARAASRRIAELEDGGLRVEPPASGQIYYRAFLVNERWRQRENRTGQPWELALARAAGGVTGILTRVEEIEDSAILAPRFNTESQPVADAAALSRALAAEAAARERAGRRPHLPVALVFADPAMTCGPTADFLAPFLEANYVLYVFLDAAAK